MKFTLNWLKDHLDTNASLDEISKALTACGLEVESITDRSKDLAPFTVAKILHAEKHPEADKLRVCKVLSDVGELQIVCGAPNAREGLHVALAKEGAVIPGNGMLIKKSKIRGVESNGMLCSLEELAIPGDSEGIVELPLTSQVGQSVAEVLGMNDPVIEIAITPNRADCLGVRGVARDLAAAGLGTLKKLDVPQSAGSAPSPVTVSITDPNCYQFIGCHISGVKNGASPEWMTQRLAAIGQRSISALVDVTNYVTFDLGRPLHVYDAKKLRGNLTVRESKAEEKIKALNGAEYTLPAGLCVIADEAGAQAIGGVIGGEDTGCTAETTDVFLEVALFNPVAVAKAGRALQIDSDARYRFERGVDVAFLEDGAKLALDLIAKLCGGAASALTLAGKTPEWQRKLPLREARVAELGGVSLPAARIEAILTGLGFACEKTVGGWNVTPPSWRADVDGEADLVEEVLRIHGYDNIPATSLPGISTLAKPAYSPVQRRAHIARRALAGRGMMELCSWSFLPQAQAVAFGGGSEALKLLNPISAELDAMRPSLLPNLLEAAKKNANRGFVNSQLFEVGLQYHDTSETGQKLVAAAIRSGRIHEHLYPNKSFELHPRKVDAFDAKADALALLEALAMNKADIITTNLPAWYHPGRSGALTLGGKVILGYFGELHPGLLADMGIECCVTGFELFLDAIPLPRAKTKAKSSLKTSDFQSVWRDFAFVVSEDVSIADIIKAIASTEKKLITDIDVFDVYSGLNMEPGKKSVAVKVTLQAADRTLSEAEISAASAAIVAAASKAFGGQLRQ